MITKQHFRLLIILISLVLLISPVLAQLPREDWLLYFDTDRQPAGITAYNPTSGEMLQLPISGEIDSIRTSGDGRIAYAQDNDIWVLDVINAPGNPTNITQTPDKEEILLNWTPDGSLLQYKVAIDSDLAILYLYDGERVFATDSGNNLNRLWNEDGWYLSSDEDNMSNPMWNIWSWDDAWRLDFDEDERAISSWYVWNGQERIDLEFPFLIAEPVWQTFQWTSDNHLFITIGYKRWEYMQAIGLTQIFYWNGSTVQKVESPSHNETFILGDWSNDGRLTFYTDSAGSGVLWYIWDGVSFTPDGVPDMSRLSPINSSGEGIDDIDWMPDGRLAIVTRGDPESDTLLGHPFSCSHVCAIEVYLWDEESLTPVIATEFNGFLVDVHDNGNIAVSPFDGLRIWGVIVYDTDLERIFGSKGPYSLSRWSADGKLAYCLMDDLYVWDGQNTIQLDTRTYSKWLIAQSYSMLCSTG